MPRFAKICLAIVGVLAVAAGAGVAWLLALDLNDYKDDVAAAVESSTGRKLVIAGDISLRPSLVPAIGVRDVRLSNPSWASRPDMARIDRLSVEIEILPLVRGDLRIRRLVVEGMDAALETAADGRANWNFETAGGPTAAPAGDQPVSIPRFAEIHLIGSRISLTRAGAGEARVVSIDRLDVVADAARDALRLAARGSYQDEAFDLDAEVGSVPAFGRGDAPLPVKFRAGALGSVVSGTGTLRPTPPGYDADAKLAVTGDDLARTVVRLHRHFPVIDSPPAGAIGPFAVSLALEVRAQAVALKDIRATVGTADAPLISLTGAVADVAGPSGVDLRVATGGATVGRLAALARPFAPGIGDHAGVAAMPLELSGRIEGDARALSITDLRLEAGSAAILRLSASGRIADVTGTPRLDIRIAAAADEISAAAEALRSLDPSLAPLVVSRLGPFSASAHVRGPPTRPAVESLTVEAGHLDFMHLAAHGRVNDPVAGAGIALAVRLEGAEIARVLGGLQRWVPGLRGMRLVDFGPYSVAAHVQGAADKITLSDLQVSAGLAGRVRVSASGQIGDAFTFSGLEVPVTISAADPRPLAEAVGVVVPDLAPATLSGTLRNWRDGYRFDAFELLAKGIDLSGDVAVRFADDRVQFEVKAAARTIDLDKLAPAKPAAGPSARDSPAAKTSPRSVFPDDPLRLELLRDLHGTFDLSAARVLLSNGRKLDRVAVSGQVGDGRLALKSFSMSLAAGRMAGNLEIEPGAVPSVSAVVAVRGVNLGDLLRSEIEGTMLTGGVANADLRLLARGNSIRALASSLTGEASAQVGEGRIANRLLDRFAGDTLRELLTMLNPVARKKDFSQLKCGVARIWFNDGIATIPKSVAFETEETAVMAGGSIDLRSEQLDFAVRPKARRGLRISFGAIAAQLVRVRGTLADPQLGVDAMGTARTAASVGAAVATVGLSFLAEQVVSEVTDVKDPCKAALAAKPGR